VSSAKATSR